MKKLLLLPLFLVGCAGSGNNQSSLAKAPITWPRIDAVQTSTYNGYSCSVLASGNVACYDGVDTTYLENMNSIDQVWVGNGIICALEDSLGIPAACANATDPSCTNPPTAAQALCWSPSNHNATMMQIGKQNGYSTANFNNGPLDIQLSLGQICITDSSFDINTNAWAGDSTICGTSIQNSGYLQ